MGSRFFYALGIIALLVGVLSYLIFSTQAELKPDWRAQDIAREINASLVGKLVVPSYLSAVVESFNQSGLEFGSPVCYASGWTTTCVFPDVLVEIGVLPSGSMRPYIDDNTNVLVEPVTNETDIDDLSGKVIVYDSQDENATLVIHRCVLVVNDSCVEKGDNNAESFGLVSRDRIRYVVRWRISRG